MPPSLLILSLPLTTMKSRGPQMGTTTTTNYNNYNNYNEPQQAEAPLLWFVVLPPVRLLQQAEAPNSFEIGPCCSCCACCSYVAGACDD